MFIFVILSGMLSKDFNLLEKLSSFKTLFQYMIMLSMLAHYNDIYYISLQ